MDPFSMVVGIVLIVTVGSIIRTRINANRRGGGTAVAETDAEARRLREEVRMLKDRVAVLERLATEDSSALDREITRLRDLS